MIAAGVINSLSKNKIAWLKTAIPSLVQVFDDFPNTSQILKFPSASLVMKNSKFAPLSPYLVAKGNPDSSGKASLTKAMGLWDVSFQLDFWCDSKPARQAMFDSYMMAMTQNNQNTGLSLQLPDYFGEWVRFDVDDVSFMDSEKQSQTSEWRLKIDLLANVRDLRQSIDYLITTIENNVDTTSPIVPPSSGSSGQIL